MKKTLITILVIAVVLIGVTVAVAEEIHDRNFVSTPNPPVTDTVPEPPIATPDLETNTEKDNNFIGVDKAKEIALKKAGLSSGDVIFDRTELDIENGVHVYEVEFRMGKKEYTADIKADDGKILEFDVDFDD